MGEPGRRVQQLRHDATNPDLDEVGSARNGYGNRPRSASQSTPAAADVGRQVQLVPHLYQDRQVDVVAHIVGESLRHHLRRTHSAGHDGRRGRTRRGGLQAMWAGSLTTPDAISVTPDPPDPRGSLPASGPTGPSSSGGRPTCFSHCQCSHLIPIVVRLPARSETAPSQIAQRPCSAPGSNWPGHLPRCRLGALAGLRESAATYGLGANGQSRNLPRTNANHPLTIAYGTTNYQLPTRTNRLRLRHPLCRGPRRALRASALSGGERPRRRGNLESRPAASLLRSEVRVSDESWRSDRSSRPADDSPLPRLRLELDPR